MREPDVVLDNGNIRLYCGDCLEILPTLQAGSVDAVVTDPPYGVTACGWDVTNLRWCELVLGVVEGESPIVVFAQQPFTTDVIAAMRRYFRHSWVWNKRFAGCFVTCNQQPMKIHEDVLVFGKRGVRYNPQKTQRDVPIKLGGKRPSITAPLNSPLPKSKVYTDRFPTSVIDLSNRSEPRGQHPTQKPVALAEYLISTYSNDFSTILDPFMGSGTTGVACIKTGRKFIGIELDRGYFDIAVKRIEKALKERDESTMEKVA